MHRSTFYRWCTRGHHGVMLASVCIGGQRFTSVEAHQALIERLTEQKAPIRPITPPGAVRVAEGQTKSQLNDASRHRRVEAALKRFGL
jgi:hypothetical protein